MIASIFLFGGSFCRALRHCTRLLFFRAFVVFVSLLVAALSSLLRRSMLFCASWVAASACFFFHPLRRSASSLAPIPFCQPPPCFLPSRSTITNHAPIQIDRVADMRNPDIGIFLKEVCIIFSCSRLLSLLSHFCFLHRLFFSIYQFFPPSPPHSRDSCHNALLCALYSYEQAMGF